MTQFSIMDVKNLPKEYTSLFNLIPQDELEIFVESIGKFTTSLNDNHPYLVTIEAIKHILEVNKQASIYWYFILARILFVSSNYQQILDYYELLDDADRIKVFFPFIARVLTYQNKYKEANELCGKIISSSDLSADSNFIDVLVFYESCFTLGLSQYFSRDLGDLGKTIILLSKTSKSINIETLAPKNFSPNLAFFEGMLLVLDAFARGETAQMREYLLSMNEVVESTTDPWLIGYYQNMYTISYLQAQEIEESIKSSKLALKNFKLVRNLRGYSIVAINIGVSYLTQGNREIGREYLESSFEPLIELENYSMAIPQMLQVARSYLDENKITKATKFAIWAEKLSEKIDISDPGTIAQFCYFYARTRDTNKSDEYLNKLRDLIQSQTNKDKRNDETDIYSTLWLYSGEGVNLLAHGNLSLASENIKKGIKLADQHNHFDFSLELSILLVEILLKEYIINESQSILYETLEIVQDLKPLISSNEISYFKVIYNIFMAYLYQAMQRTSEGINWYRQASEMEIKDPNSFIFGELKRFDAISKLADTTHDETQLLTNEQISVLTVLECLRILKNFQLQSINSDRSTEETELPLMLLIVNRNSGLSLYDHKFTDTSVSLNEILISGFLSAITGFSRELFGGGSITAIKQGERVILMDNLKDDNFLVLILNDESYLMRKKLRQYSKELTNLMLLDSISFGDVVHRTDLNKTLLDKLTSKIFYDDEESIEFKM